MFSNLHNYRISRFFFVHCTKWGNSDFTPRRTLMTQFFWTPHAVPRNPKNFRKIGGYLLIWSMPRALFRVKIKPMQLPQHRTAYGFNHMTFTFLLLCCKHFQHALLKAFFHNMTTALLHRTRAHVLIYAINISLLQYIGLYAPCYTLIVSLVFLDVMQTAPKKRTLTTSI